MIRSRTLLFLTIAALCIGVGGFIGGRFLYRAFLAAPQAGQKIMMEIREGASLAEVAVTLAEKNIIPSAFEYRLFAMVYPGGTNPFPNTYGLRTGMNYRQLTQLFRRGPGRQESELLVIEGWSLDDEIAYLGTEKRITPAEIERITGRSQNRAPFDAQLRSEFSFLQALPFNRSLDGYLFPETYRVWDDLLPEGLIRKQLAEFQRRMAGVEVTKASMPLKTLDEVVTLASIVEKEVRKDEDRKIVAGIFLRRLREGMALQSDATLNYVTRGGRAQATNEDLAVDSPYNSYKYRGLPPSPICNPSEGSIQAVLHPTASSYRYFLTDSQGKVLYAATFEGHKQNRLKAGY
ncbi:MAG: endolytic transglycosylase MltG [Patescibacteria group bacterium]